MGDVIEVLEAESDALVRSHAIMLERSPKPDDLIDKIRAFAGTPHIEPKDVYAFRMVAASDGVDSYWTQQDHESSLKPMAQDLTRGQSLLGNHDYETFPYGSSIGGGVVPADTTSPIYEETFGRMASAGARDEMKTKNWLVGEYYVVRGLELNGNKTDSIIRGMEMGAIRKASISFMPERYQCGLDGKDMLAMSLFGRAAKRHEELEEKECLHLPGVSYGEDGRAWAVMMGSQCIETSLVYKNSSPSSLLLRKAEDMARAGMLSAHEAAEAEVVLGTRLPGFERTMWVPDYGSSDLGERATTNSVTVGAKEVVVTTKRKPDAGEEVVDPPTSDAAVEDREPETPEPEEEREEQPTEESETPTAGTVVSEFVAASTAVRSAIAAELLSSDELEEVGAAAATFDRDLAARGGPAVSIATRREVDAARVTRDEAVEAELGRPISVEAIRSLKADADLGAKLFEQMVGDAIVARNGLGAEYDVESYRKLLRESRSVDFVVAEKRSYEQLKGERFKAGRQVVPADPRADKKPRKAPAPLGTTGEDDSNVFAPRAQKQEV